MKLFDKLFGKEKPKQTEEKPTSRRDLKTDLLKYNQNHDQNQYGQIVHNLMNAKIKIGFQFRWSECIGCVFVRRSNA